ncbi:MAG: UvrABC system protein A [Planctomycetes bacterium]|nr:UvrABC system protein A [Planctomycetota bacterium]
MSQRPAEPDRLVVTGAREHNLRNVSVSIPKNAFTVFSGVSGSGKTSLAFDTIFAEGQRRYVESLSAYARQFLGQLPRPQFDAIRGLAPTIAIEQKTASRNPRSTVGTVTEVHDYLRVLFARLGEPSCPSCGGPVGAGSAEAVVEELLREPAGRKVILLAPLVENRKGEHRDVLDAARKQGFVRVRVDGVQTTLDDVTSLEAKKKHTVEAVVDRLVTGQADRQRLTDSVETALRAGDGRMRAAFLDDGSERAYSDRRVCAKCGTAFPDMTPQLFSWNSPQGACKGCDGLGRKLVADVAKMIPDPSLTLEGGAVLPWASRLRPGATGMNADSTRSILEQLAVPLDVPWSKLAAAKKKLVLEGAGDRELLVRMGGKRWTMDWKTKWEGLVARTERKWRESQSESVRKDLQRWMTESACPDCGGRRLRRESLSVRIGGRTIAETTELPVDAALAHFDAIPFEGGRAKVAGEVLREIRARLRFLSDVGLGYLTLDRSAATLSGGEAQRIRLASQIGSELTGVVYVLDEPSIGLHARDHRRLLRSLMRLRDLGNTLLVVEHDSDTIEAADHVVDFGPGAGVHGGRVVAEGTPAEVRDSEASLTGAYLAGRRTLPRRSARRGGTGKSIRIEGAAAHNLRDVDAEIPLGMFVAVTGVSGAGKSTLVDGILLPAAAKALHGAEAEPAKHRRIRGLEHLDKVVEIDQSPIGRTPRSNPATYTGVFDPIRNAFAELPEAKARGYGPGRFSFNVKGGRCEECEGAGMKVVEMHFLPDVYVPCETCKGTRFNAATREILYRGKSISDVLRTNVDDAAQLFQAHRHVAGPLEVLRRVGLGYLELGQSATTLSGGEAQRVKLATELARRATGRTLYVLDEPTTGLHFEDVRRLLEVLQELADQGNTVLVIEHHLDVIAAADHVIDLGPEGGAGGGRIVACGTPEAVSKTAGSHTGAALKTHLAR